LLGQGESSLHAPINLKRDFNLLEWRSRCAKCCKHLKRTLLAKITVIKHPSHRGNAIAKGFTLWSQ
ncbi:MAG: hypothetical protein QGH52_05490, partial [Prochlorococcaceae cyanobacterium ETNP1_MAG_8]|nr:hypothetical protein [Prochlorococcaceae cyanobacterium ETNP1_MAG_8]